MEAIYCVDANNGLSKDGIIPWNSKKDMKFFYDKTKYNVVIMGKNTFFSLPENARPLKNRLNIVLTSNPTILSKNHNKFLQMREGQSINVSFTDDINIYKQILENKSNYRAMFPYLNNDFKIFIIGGKTIYEQFIPLCDKVWITKLKNNYDCDLKLDYSFQNFKEPEIIDEDDEMTIYCYNKKNIGN